MTDALCQLSPGEAGARSPAVACTAGSRRPRKDPTRLSAQEYLILLRMKRIDRGQGCHAAIERIGRSYDDRHQSFSPSQTRRHIRRLRELGEICFAGQTPDGRNVYLFPDRSYVREDVPLDLGRPVDYLKSLPSGPSWSTEKAAQILKLSERGETASRITLIDEYPVNRQILKTYSEATIRRAICRLKAAYPTFKNIQSPSALLRYFVSLELQDQKKRQAAVVPEPKPPASPGPRLPADAEKQILTLLREGRPMEAHRLAADLAGSAQSKSAGGAEASLAAAALQTSPTVSHVLGHYLKSKPTPDSPSASSFHRQKSASLARLLGDISIRDLTPVELSLYQRKRRADHVSERTIRQELKVLRQALEQGVRAGLVQQVVVEGLSTPPGRAGPRRNKRAAEEVASCR